jgi:hypothetical protein
MRQRDRDGAEALRAKIGFSDVYGFRVCAECAHVLSVEIFRQIGLGRVTLG